MLHSASANLAVPSVIRLRRYVRIPHRSRVPLTRAALMRRDNYLCAYCGSKADTIDHVIPRSRGGQHVWENCVASCTRCNHRKADHLIEDIGWTLRCDPAAPRGAHWRLIGAARRRPAVGGLPARAQRRLIPGPPDPRARLTRSRLTCIG